MNREESAKDFRARIVDAAKKFTDEHYVNPTDYDFLLTLNAMTAAAEVSLEYAKEVFGK